MKISPEDIRATAGIIETVVGELTDSKTKANTKATNLVNGDWNTPKASANFHSKWSEWNTHMEKMINLGPDFVKFLRDYANDAESLDSAYGG